MKAPSLSDRFVAVGAYLSDEDFGYDNWHARQFGTRGTVRPAVLILCHSVEEQKAALAFLEAREAATT